MEKRRQQQLLEQTDKAYKCWLKNIDSKSNVDDIEETIEIISEALAFGTIIVSGRHNPSAYIGTYKQCADLKKQYGGQIGAVSNSWYWLGFAQTDSLQRLVNNQKKNLILNVPDRDIEDAALNICEVASLDIKYGCSHNGRASYIGSYKVCILLKRKFGGKIGRICNHWHWIGLANFEQITEVYGNYQKSNKRFRRKQIVFMG